ncbi:histidine triad nucleotide-binding protein [Bacillus sp. JCM 19047]|uniref:HIT family protein n=1 Tax=Shouchella miscanthi TaxID=2598861 RepID=A0ABU6NPE0_9BACI|nr:HIT family protein [Shouchella miscanthi]GAF22269.1 histidine triad nucleotide-binding protein [Bacillus sp. JCM 19047]
MSDCIFCAIRDGQLPATKLYEDEHVLAFYNIQQITKGHTLIIPKQHHEAIFDLPSETASHLFSVVPKLASALKESYSCKGMNIVNNNGQVAGQTVFHYHLHLVPRYGEEAIYSHIWDKEASPDHVNGLEPYTKRFKDILNSSI